MKENTEIEILKLIAYFDVFEYPLKMEEIEQFLSITSEEVSQHINRLEEKKVIAVHGEFVGTEGLIDKVDRRERGNTKAKELADKATKNARLISKFPFVRGVLISGSYSKGFVGEDGDIDYFIVTKPGRLWVARTSLILYKKLLLLNSHEYFCVNYFVDENHLEIEEKNIFTATELITLLPMVNEKLYEQLMQRNEWVQDYYPSLFHANPKIEDRKDSTMQRLSEKSLGGKVGNKLDDYFMRLTFKKWKKKFGFLSDEDFEIAMKTSTNVSKHHPNNFQKKVLEKHQKICQQLIAKLEEKRHVKTAV